MKRSFYIILTLSVSMLLSCDKDKANEEVNFVFYGEYHYYSALHNGPELVETKIDTTIEAILNKTEDSVFFSSNYFNARFAKNSDGIYPVGYNGDFQHWEYILTNDSLKYYYSFSSQVGGDVASGYFNGKVQ